MNEYAGRIRFAFRHLPLPNQPLAILAAQFSFCAGKQNAFWQFHDRLFEPQLLTRELIEQLPAQLNLNLETFRQCLTAPEMRASLARDSAEAHRLGINATPSFVINGRLYSGLIRLEDFRLIVEKELRLAQTRAQGQKP
jgi:protein-disulfide isomerase